MKFPTLLTLTTLTLTLPSLALPTVLTPRATCAPLIHLHIPGTSESGLGSVGAALAVDLAKVVVGVDVRPVVYDTAVEYVVTVAEGVIIAAKQIAQIVEDCPDAKISISGYSKGAIVLHNVYLPAKLTAKIVSAVTFGDIYELVEENSNHVVTNPACYFSFCNAGDPVCLLGLNIAAHIAYATDGSTGRAAADIAGCYSV